MPEVTIQQALEMGAEHQRAGRLAEAEAIYRLVLQNHPENAHALNLLGVTLVQRGQGEAGIEFLRRAVQGAGDSPGYWSNMGNALREMGHLDEAEEACRKSIALKPDLAEAHNNLANVLREAGKLDESLEACRTAIRLKPELAEVHNNVGTVLSQKQQFNEAIAVFREALRLRPDFPEALNNLGTALAEVGRLDEAIAALRQAIRVKSDYGDAYANLGSVLSTAGRLEEGLVMARRSVALNPRHAGRRWNLSLELLLRGMFAKGWSEYEWRWLWKEFKSPKLQGGQPVWKREDLNGKTILLHFEQGLGDTIQFVRYAPLVCGRGGRVIVQCQRELVRLLRSNPDLGDIIGMDDALPEFDFHCPLLSLPLVFRTDFKSIPAGIPYLKAEPEQAAVWRERLKQASSKFKVGVVWAGNPGHKLDRHRSMELAKFRPLAQVDGVALVSLQKGDAAGQVSSCGFELIDLTAELEDFADTAALIENLDLVIGVDTAVLHLAGAMGKRAWMLLPVAPDWRWLRGREDSPWYPTVKLFRQWRFGDWGEVVARVSAALSDLTAASGAV